MPTFECRWAECKFTTKSGHDMREHIRSVHKQEFSARCCRCLWDSCPKKDMEYQTLNGFTKHIENEHVALFPDTAAPTPVVRPRVSQLTDAPALKNPRPSYQCGWDGCAFSSSSKQDVVDHIRNVHIKDFSARYCKCLWERCPKKSREYHTVSGFTEHIESQHVSLFLDNHPLPPVDDPIETPTVYSCKWDKCTYSSTSKQDVVDHIRTVHIKDYSVYNCKCLWDHCPKKSKKYGTVSGFAKHIESEHVSLFLDNPPRPPPLPPVDGQVVTPTVYFCEWDKCTFSSTSEQAVLDHMRDVHLKDIGRTLFLNDNENDIVFPDDDDKKKLEEDVKKERDKKKRKKGGGKKKQEKGADRKKRYEDDKKKQKEKVIIVKVVTG